MIRVPNLIQRADIKVPMASADARLSQAVNFDYMGSSEFEFGALPASFRRIEAEKDTWRKYVVDDIKDGETSLRVYGSFEDGEFEVYKQHLLALRANKIRTHECTRFEADYKRTKYFATNFWWDIDNDVMFGFKKEFMNALPTFVVNSLIYMNEQKANK